MYKQILLLSLIFFKFSITIAQVPAINKISSEDKLKADKKFIDALTPDELNGIVPEEEAIEWVDKYRKKRWRRIKTIPLVGRKYDSKAIWFDLPKLIVFYEVVKKYETTHPTIKIDGFRLYYGVYQKNSKFSPNQHTIMIVPTTTEIVKGKIIHKDVQIEIKGPNGELKTLVVLVENKGQLCPLPPCQGALLMKNDPQYINPE